jgi:hypothetical protein
MMLKTMTFAAVAMIGSAAMAQLMPGSVDRSKMTPNMAMPGQLREAKDLVRTAAITRACGLSAPKLREAAAFIDGWTRSHITADGRNVAQTMTAFSDTSKLDANPAAKAQYCTAMRVSATSPVQIRKIDQKVAYIKRCTPQYTGSDC